MKPHVIGGKETHMHHDMRQPLFAGSAMSLIRDQAKPGAR
jgi:hypothetical protein